MKKFLTLLAALLLLGSMSVVHADTYTVAGSEPLIFGDTWNPENASADMTHNGDVWVFAKNVTLSSGSVEFKVCQNHDWSPSYPSNNYVLDIPADGTYWVIITFDGTNVKAAAASSFTVAGDKEALFGTGTTWSPSTDANDMTWDSESSVFKFEKEHVELSGNVLFKVCANHGWDFALPSDNYSLPIAESGEYTVTITFNPATATVSASAVLEQAAVVIPTIKLHGDFTGSWADTDEFTVADGNLTASLTKTIGIGSYEFGVKIDGTWTSNGSPFTRANPSYEISSGSGNCTFVADASGEYTFTWTYATNTLSVTYPEPPAEPEPSVTFNAGDKIYYDFTAYGQGINTMNGEYQASTDVIFSVTLGSQWIVTANTNLFKSAATADGEGIWQFVKCSTLPTEGQNMIVSTDGATYEWSTYVPTYTVAGSSTSIFGAAWDVTVAANNMTLDEGVYKFEKTGVELASGNVTFKVVLDRDWNQAWPSEDLVLNIPEEGIYTINITFVPATGTVAAEANKTGEAAVTNSAKMIGSWNSWGEATAFTLAANELSASGTIHLDAGSYEFKIVVNDGDYHANGYWFHREYTGVDGIDSNGSNMSITADIAGDYTFTWTFATNAISIEFPELTWTEVRSGLAAERYYTVCWPKKMLYVRGASVWSFAGKDANMAYLVKEEGALDAGKPYIICAEGAKFEAVLVGDDAAAGNNNGLHGTLSYMDADDLAAAGATHMLYNNQLRPLGSGNYLEEKRAYVILTEITGGKPAGMPAHKVRGIPMQRDEATGIDELNAFETPRKTVINGQLFIIRGENMFDATGRLVK